MTTKFIVLGHTVQKFSGQFPCQAWFEAPLGAEPFAVTAAGEGLAILAVSPYGAPDVQYPLIIMPSGAPIEFPIGHRPGAYIGSALLQGEEGREHALVFRAEPWPRDVKQADQMHKLMMRALGEA